MSTSTLPPEYRPLRKHLRFDALVTSLRQRFSTLPDQRSGPNISLPDALLSAFAMFSLKDPSLLAFDERRRDPNSNLQRLYHIENVPCDSRLRELLDPIPPDTLRPCFSDIFRQLQRGKALEPFAFYEGHYLIATDGVQFFSSKAIHCPQCLTTVHRDGSVTSKHQMLGAVLVHPDQKVVIPLMPEPIVVQDGTTKNDCEQNALKRFLLRFRGDHPHLPVIVTADDIASKAPQIRECQRHNVRFLLVAKPSDHAYLFRQVEAAWEAGRAHVLTLWDEKTRTLNHYRWVKQVPLNESNRDLFVDVIEFWEVQESKVTYMNSWITDLSVTCENGPLFVRGGRAKWKIENETFNTLKNQGYSYEHNYGHGVQHLANVFAVLMMLAFLVDQTQQLCCVLFQAAWEKVGSKIRLWERIRCLLFSFEFASMAELYEALVRGLVPQKPVLQPADGSGEGEDSS